MAAYRCGYRKPTEMIRITHERFMVAGETVGHSTRTPTRCKKYD